MRRATRAQLVVTARPLRAGVSDSWIAKREPYSHLTVDSNSNGIANTCIALTVLSLTTA